MSLHSQQSCLLDLEIPGIPDILLYRAPLIWMQLSYSQPHNWNPPCVGTYIYLYDTMYLRNRKIPIRVTFFLLFFAWKTKKKRHALLARAPHFVNLVVITRTILGGTYILVGK